MRQGQSFEDKEVAACYAYRPDYPTEVFDKLVSISPRITSILDLGCGTGKIARGISESFISVTAVDASAAMLASAAPLPGGNANNITWVHGLAESAELPGQPFDLIVAAASIHWMDHEFLFPRLKSVSSTDHVFAVVEGDGAFQPPWQEAWDDFLAYWIHELKGEKYEPLKPNSDHARFMTRYRDWLDIEGEAVFDSAPFSQSIGDFIKCQHSRDTFAAAKLGNNMKAFDEDLRKLLTPYSTDDSITYTIQTRVEWGVIKDHKLAI